jgi:amino-acid N-acetyltransferase
MIIRPAIVSDAQAICDLVNHYAEQDLMLHRSLESVYESLRDFIIAEEDGRVLGCAALDIYWADQAEIRSLAVGPAQSCRGIGTALVRSCLDEAKRLGVTKVFALTYEQGFFERLGFTEVDIKALPEKVCRECLEWYSKGHRHETAMIIEVKDGEGQ